MTDLSNEILRNYQKRKTKAQKTAFIDLIASRFPDAKVETSGAVKSRNIVVGDIDSAKVVFTAHYDTCAALPFPNFIAPRNIPASIIYALLIVLPVFFLRFALYFIIFSIADDPALAKLISSLGFMLALFVLLYIMLIGVPNKNNANDNTSGVITLIETLDSLTEDERKRAMFVFFDNEEYGMLGSSAFKKLHKREMADKLLINFDCVSDGDHIMVIPRKKADAKHSELLRDAFKPESGKQIVFGNSLTTLYPSDQMSFTTGVGVAAFKKMPIIGYYMNRIHTKRDTMFDARNIELLAAANKRIIDGLM